VLYVCCQFIDEVRAFDTALGSELGKWRVSREPFACASTPSGHHLIVANHLPAGRSDLATTAAGISVVDTQQSHEVQHLALPPGSTQLKDVAISPDGRWACVSHLIGRFGLPTTHLDRGWMVNNAITLVDLADDYRLHTVLLDNLLRGAANPWAVEWSTSGDRLFVTHAGTHEVSIIEFQSLIERLRNCKSDHSSEDDLVLLRGIRRRLAVPGQGARSVCVAGERVYVGNYFTDEVVRVDLGGVDVAAVPVSIRGPTRLSGESWGEQLFNDATLCFQGWQSCGSCHSHDARIDGLNWDLLNDGLGNPKNTRSLVWSHRTPPVMSLGVRDRAETAVRSGLRFIQFAQRPRAEARAIDAWLASLRPIASPYPASADSCAAAIRGQKIFRDPAVGCADCHPPTTFTDGHLYDVGTAGPYDHSRAAFDTPALVELWRTGPYLHDGSATTLREVLVDRNVADLHGTTSNLTEDQIEDLEAFLLTL
jgi:hypothetical protein